MTIVILGASRVGMLLARQLINEKKEVVVIEKDPKKAHDVSRQLDCLTINDSGNSLEGLEKAGVEKADFFVSVTDSDEINMISCALVSSSFDKPMTIARVRNLDYSKTWDKQPGFLGINYIINPEIEVAHAIVRAVEYGAVSSVVDFETSDLQMRNLTIEKDSLFSGKSLEELRRTLNIPFIIPVISRGEEMIIPDGSTTIIPFDQIWILADKQDFKTLLREMDKPQVFLRNIIIAGGSNIGAYVAQHLTDEPEQKTGRLTRLLKKFTQLGGRNVHIIESDYNRCKELTEFIPNVQVTNADISEEQVLEDGRFNKYDLLITATGNPELNIVAAAHSRKTGIPRSLALVRKGTTAKVAQSLGVDVAISVNETLVSSIQKIIRKNYTRSIYNFADSNLEIMELSVAGRPDMSGKSIKEIKLPKNSVILMITRDGKHIIPYGDLVLNLDDYLMIITTKENIRELE